MSQLQASLTAAIVGRLASVVKSKGWAPGPNAHWRRTDSPKLSTREAKEIMRDTKARGGASYSVVGHSTPLKGKIVSPYPDRSRHTRPVVADYETLVEYTKRNADLLSRPNHYLGLWIDPDDKLVDIDISIIVQSDAEARELCYKYNQKAYFDLELGEEKFVDVRKAAGRGVRHALVRVANPRDGISKSEYEALCKQLGVTPQYRSQEK